MLHKTADGQVVTLRAVGLYTTEDEKRALETVFADPALQGEVQLVLDVQRADSSPTRDEVLNRVDALKTFRPRLVACAFLVSDLLQYGIARMHQAYSEAYDGPPIGIFHSTLDARIWLAAHVSPAEYSELGEYSPMGAAAHLRAQR